MGGFGFGGFTQSSKSKAEFAKNKKVSTGLVVTSDNVAKLVKILDRMLAAGGVKSASESLELRNALAMVVPDPAPCLLAAWVGGARSEKENETLETDATAEKHCGTAGFFWDSATVEGSLKKLAKVSPNAASKLGIVGKAKTVKSHKKWKADSREDSDKILATGFSFAAGGGLGIVALLALALLLTQSRR